jgi:hypothetical protein
VPLLAEAAGPLFEAGLTASGALAYADVMLPDRSDGTLRWRMIEVKSSTSVKDYQRDDIAVQSFIAAEAGVPLASISLAHINNAFIYFGGGRYEGLFEVVDLTEETVDRHEEVRQWLTLAHETAAKRKNRPSKPAITATNRSPAVSATTATATRSGRNTRSARCPDSGNQDARPSRKQASMTCARHPTNCSPPSSSASRNAA